MPHSYGYRARKNEAERKKRYDRLFGLPQSGIETPKQRWKQKQQQQELLLKAVEQLTGKRLTALTGAKVIRAAQWRVPTSRAPFQRWDSGADETVPTRMAIASINKLKTQPERFKLASEMNTYRMDNSQHIWTTEDGQIAGHVPAIKYDPYDTKRSVTTEHGRRDKWRGQIVSSVFDAGPQARSIAAKASTIVHFMSPGEELLTAKPTKSVYANYTHIGDLTQPSELNKLASVQQEVREHHKITLATELWDAGRHSEVPSHYHPFMGRGESPRKIRSKMVDQMDDPSFGVNTHTSSDTDLTLTPSGRFVRPLSPARKRIS